VEEDPLLLLAGTIRVGGLELGDQLSILGFHGLIVSAEAVVRASADAGQRCRDGPAPKPAMRGRRLQLLGYKTPPVVALSAQPTTSQLLTAAGTEAAPEVAAELLPISKRVHRTARLVN
jgi:hypothetical protein